jgi:hypothetical protein
LEGVSIKGTFWALAEGEVEEVVVLVLTLPLVEAAAVPVESKKFGPDMKGSM